jgi:hypothetical protein
MIGVYYLVMRLDPIDEQDEELDEGPEEDAAPG